MKRFFLFIVDIVVLYSALALMLLIRYGTEDFQLQWDFHLFPFGFLFILWIASFYIMNLYEVLALRNSLPFYTSLVRAYIFAGLFSVAFFYFLPFYGITPRTNLFIFIAIFALLFTGSRSLLNRLFFARFKKSFVIVGVNPQAVELARFVQNNPQFGYSLAHLVDISPGDTRGHDPEFKEFELIKGGEDIVRYIREDNIGTFVVSPESYRVPELIDAFYRTLDANVSLRSLASFSEEVTGRVPLGAIDQMWLLDNFAQSHHLYESAKRIVDIAVAVIVGIVTLPVMCTVYLAILIGSGKPILYRQDRMGKSGNSFSIIKFRTMRKDAEKETGAVWAQDNDPRITRLGRFLRKSRLDELPQLWNILGGEMSFVGPRAERPEFHERLKKEIPFYEERYIIKPGLTGWAQINYQYGSSVADAREKLQYDLYYIKNRSLIFDFGIILRTINISLRQAGK